MTQQANISKRTLTVGDYIAFDTPAQDVDTPDFTVWMKITAVVFEDGFRGYKVCFPDGEPMHRTIPARAVGRFKSAADFATDEKDLPAMEKAWTTLTFSTRSHDWKCDCADCLKRNALGQEITDLYQTEFVMRAKRIASYETEKAVTNLGY